MYHSNHLFSMYANEETAKGAEVSAEIEIIANLINS